jgi:hypothetical protein
VPLASSPSVPIPPNWTIFGHSYFQMAFGTRTQQGRPDGYFRNLLDVQQGLNLVNHAQAGSRACIPGDWGFGRVLNQVKGWTGGAGNLGNTAPYVVAGEAGSGGAYLLGWGINDVGFNGQTAQNNTAYQHALRTVISRCRMSTLGSTGGLNYPGGTGTFTNGSTAWSSGAGSQGFGTGGAANILWTTTAGAFFTLTLPSDYKGETVALCFMGNFPTGTTNNLITISGTAGVSMSFTTDSILPAASLSQCPVTKRITNLSAANAGQTIVVTATTIGNAGAICMFDSWWLEADNAPPVIVCNTARLCDNPLGGAGTSGYLAYAITVTATSLSGTAVSSTPSTIPVSSTWGISSAGQVTCPSAGGTVTISYTGITATSLTGCTTSGGSGNYSSNSLSWSGPTDADVVTFNTYLTALMAEFDGMVQVADLDSVLNKSQALFSFDGLHMNELGAARIAQAVYSAVQRLSPTSPWGPAANLQPPFAIPSPLIKPYQTGQWYTSDTAGTAGGGTAYTAVAGDVWAIPLFISSGVTQWVQWSMVQTNTPTAAPTVFMAIFEDRMMQGYPMTMHIQPANSAALSLLAAAGTFTSTTTSGQNGFLSQNMDPGLYWLVIKIVTNGGATAAQFSTLSGQSIFLPNLTATGGVPAAGLNGWKLTGQGAGAMVGRFPAGAVASANAPVIGVKTLLAAA